MFVKTQGGAHTSCWFLGTKFVTTHAIYKKKWQLPWENSPWLDSSRQGGPRILTPICFFNFKDFPYLCSLCIPSDNNMIRKLTTFTEPKKRYIFRLDHLDNFVFFLNPKSDQYWRVRIAMTWRVEFAPPPLPHPPGQPVHSSGDDIIDT